MSVGALKPRESNQTLAADPLTSQARPSVLLALVALLFLIFFGSNLLKLTDRWRNDPSYSHGFIVPFIALGLAVRAWRRLGRPVEGDVRIGSMAMAAGATLHLLLTVINNPMLDFVAVGLVLWGMAVAVGGVEWAWGFLFPIGFLFFMFPLPATWTNFAGLWLQEWVAQVSAVLIDPFVVCYRRGNSLYLAGVPTPLVVAAECSGLRQIVSFVSLGVLVGGLSGKSTSFRVLLAAAAIPTAIVANVARILLMATASVWFGTQWMSGWMHDAPALVTLPLGLALFAAVGWGLGRIISPLPCTQGREAGGERQETCGKLNPSPQPLSPEYRGEGLPGSVKQGLRIAVVCLFVALLTEGGLAWYLRSAETTPYPDLCGPFAALPRELPTSSGTWQGQDVPNLDAFRAKLPYRVEDLLYRRYAPESGRAPLSLYMVYSRRGDDRKHHPEICIRDASGATEDFDARRQIALDADGRRTVMRFRFHTATGRTTTVYYWHYSLEALPQPGQTMLRRLYQQQNHPVPSLTVQVSLEAEAAELEAVEKGFLVAVDSALCKTQLPATARIGCNRLPIALVRD